jgi:type II secretory pathway component GspD/PulD (secretin)
VLIDAQIVEISPDKDEFTMGVDWDYWFKNNVRFVTTLAAPTLTSATTIADVLYLGMSAKNSANSPTHLGQYKSIIDMLRVVGKTKILSSPRIMVLNNQEAKILVGTKDAYITSTTSQTSGSPTVTAQAVTFVDVGIRLFVTPTINHEGFVTMKIKPEISSSTRTSITSQNETTQIPIVSTSEVETTIMVKDGTTIIIAGLKKDQDESETKKIPILGDIPLLGAAFRNYKSEKTKNELVIFITPHIVSGDEPLDYVSLTKDKDISMLQNIAQAKSTGARKIGQDSRGYRKAVFAEIQRQAQRQKQALPKPYPKGEAEVFFSLNSLGEFIDQPRVTSSTNPGLNSIVIDCVKQAAPFGVMPEELDREGESFKIKLSYE